LIVCDASAVVGAALSVPERALPRAEEVDLFALSATVDTEIAEVLARPKFERAIPLERCHRIMAILKNGKPIPVAGEAGKVGCYFIVDRTTGQLIRKSDPCIAFTKNAFSQPTKTGVVMLPGADDGSESSPRDISFAVFARRQKIETDSPLVRRTFDFALSGSALIAKGTGGPTVQRRGSDSAVPFGVIDANTVVGQPPFELIERQYSRRFRVGSALQRPHEGSQKPLDVTAHVRRRRRVARWTRT
jgi:hypothetical protein